MPLSDRVTLYHVLENRPVTDTYLDNRGDPKRRRAMAQAVVEFFSDTPFIWSISEEMRNTGDFAGLRHDVVGADGRCHSAYLTPKANGINCYQNIHAAAWLGTIKLPSSLLEIIKRLWPGDARRFALVEYELYACMQFLARANSRRFDSADQVRYVVADKVQADYVARMWNLPPHRVLPLPMQTALKADLDDVASKGTGRKRSLTDAECRERQRQRMANQRAAKAVAAGRQVGRSGRPRKAPAAPHNAAAERLRVPALNAPEKAHQPNGRNIL